MLIRIFPTLLLLAALLPAQDAPARPAPVDTAMTAKVAKALRATADMKNTAFGASWGADLKLEITPPLPAAVLERMAGKVSGAFFEDRLTVLFDNQERDELLQVGRHTLARSGDGPWRLRKASYADGNAMAFLPDPPLLLRLLASYELSPAQRAVGSLDNRPVEIVSMTLTPLQNGELVFAGALPRPLAATRSVAGGAGRAAATPPDVTVDVAIAFDPATGVVHRVQCRTYSKAGGGAAMMLGGAGAGGPVPRAGEPEKKAAADPMPGATVEYVDGLPVRPREGLVVTNFELRLHDHGKAPVPVLDDQQMRLLGR